MSIQTVVKGSLILPTPLAFSGHSFAGFNDVEDGFEEP